MSALSRGRLLRSWGAGEGSVGSGEGGGGEGEGAAFGVSAGGVVHTERHAARSRKRKTHTVGGRLY